MSLSPFDKFADDCRVWVYGFDRVLDDRSKAVIEKQLSGFLREWNAHGEPVDGAFAVLHNRFAILAGSCPGGISGCSIDSSVANFKQLKEQHDLDGLNRNLIFFRNDSGDVASLDRPSFQRAVSDGRIGPDTVVFDTTLTTVGGLRSGFETPFKNCWHARVFTTSGLAQQP